MGVHYVSYDGWIADEVLPGPPAPAFHVADWRDQLAYDAACCPDWLPDCPLCSNARAVPVGEPDPGTGVQDADECPACIGGAL